MFANANHSLLHTYELIICKTKWKINNTAEILRRCVFVCVYARERGRFRYQMPSLAFDLHHISILVCVCAHVSHAFLSQHLYLCTKRMIAMQRFFLLLFSLYL